MKIVVTGSIFVGKTTVVNSLKEVNGIITLPETASEFVHRDKNIVFRPDFQDILFDEQTKRESALQSQGHHIIICDRGIPDIIIHAKFFGQTIKPEWEEWMRTYDYSFVPSTDDVNFNPPQGMYLENYDWVNFRDIMHKLTIEILKTYLVPFELLQGSTEYRREILLKRVQSLLEFREGRINKERE